MTAEVIPPRAGGSVGRCGGPSNGGPNNGGPSNGGPNNGGPNAPGTP